MAPSASCTSFILKHASNVAIITTKIILGVSSDFGRHDHLLISHSHNNLVVTQLIIAVWVHIEVGVIPVVESQDVG